MRSVWGDDVVDVIDGPKALAANFIPDPGPTDALRDWMSRKPIEVLCLVLDQEGVPYLRSTFSSPTDTVFCAQWVLDTVYQKAVEAMSLGNRDDD